MNLNQFHNFKENYPATNQGAYLMNAAIGAVHREVSDEMKSWIERTANFGAVGDLRFFTLLEDAREVAARFVGLKKEEVAFSGSTSLNMNFFAQMLKEKGIKKIISPEEEFPSSTLAWFHHGYDVDLVKSRDGRIWEEDLIKKASGPDCLVVVSAIQFLTGQRMDLKFLSDELEKKEVQLIINGTQIIGQFKIDLGELNFLAFTSSLHKWLGADLGLSLICMPKIEREKIVVPVAGWTGVESPWRLANEKPQFLKDMGAFQLGTMPFNALAGVKKAMEIQLDIGQDKIASLVLENSQKISKAIEERGYKLLSPRGRSDEQSGILTFKYEKDLEKALFLMEKAKVFINGRRAGIRASIHFYNDDEDVERFKEALSLI